MNIRKRSQEFKRFPVLKATKTINHENHHDQKHQKGLTAGSPKTWRAPNSRPILLGQVPRSSGSKREINGP